MHRTIIIDLHKHPSGIIHLDHAETSAPRVAPPKRLQAPLQAPAQPPAVRVYADEQEGRWSDNFARQQAKHTENWRRWYYRLHGVWRED